MSGQGIQHAVVDDIERGIAVLDPSLAVGCGEGVVHLGEGVAYLGGAVGVAVRSCVLAGPVSGVATERARGALRLR